MKISLLSTTRPSQWTAALAARDPMADIYFSPQYHAAHEANGDGRAAALLAEDGASWLFVPYLLREIPDAKDYYGPQLFDLQSCPGYSGALGVGSPEWLEVAWSRFEDVWRSQRVVAAFLRLHPLLDQTALFPPTWDVVSERQTVSVDLRDPVGLKNHRNAVAAARRAGIVATGIFSPPDEAIRLFARDYERAMTLKGADASHLFTLPYFQALRGLSTQLWLFSARYIGECVAQALILRGPEFAHYHLAFRVQDTLGYGTNLLLQTVAEEAAETGLVSLHLGGGLTNALDDPLFAFKARVGNRRHTFRTARRVIDPAAYAALATQPNGWFLPWRKA